MKNPKGLFWHVHHDVLCEWSNNIEERIDYIKKNKPEGEIETRLRLLKAVKGKLPEEFYKANKAWYKAWDEANKARNKARNKENKAWYEANKARDKAYKARNKYKNEIEALHKNECPDCPWNGRTIFPKKGE